MSSILIAGLGYVGEALADRLHDSGTAVIGLTRTAETAEPLDKAKPYPVHPCDISEARAVDALHEKYPSFQTIVHCAASGRGEGAGTYARVYLEGVRNLLATFAPETLLFTSSTSVYAQCGGEEV
ncbi:MAG: NAD-dependent epimerase/dehydratase family protein, partial [Verrucomicrobiales bacterium]